MAWYSSWIPGLPSINFAIPVSIQNHFVSFLLKKSLGHLLKPGQLDLHQIDSQIGSGYVQVNDLELDPEAINHHLTGIPLTLTQGRLSSVKARVPWPNPLASTIGLSLNNLNLVFSVQNSPPVDISPAALSESISSVAESFIQEENAPLDEVNFWKSIHQDSPSLSKSSMDPSLPGGLGYSVANDGDHGKIDMDPAGVSVVATLIERLLARFEFDAQAIQLTLNHPGNMSLHIFIENVVYQTANEKAGERPTFHGERRTLSVKGLSFSVQDLKPTSQYPAFSDTSSKRTSRPGSPPSSMDEDAEADLSRSIVSFSLKDPSPPSSVSSSLYESALSFSQPAQGVPEDPVDIKEIPLRDKTPSPPTEQMVCSFGTTPITVELLTPSPTQSSSEDNPFVDAEDPSLGEIDINITCGVIAFAFQPWQVNGFLCLLDVMSTVEDSNSSVSSTPLPLPSYAVKADLRGVVVLLSSHQPHAMQDSQLIQEDFFAKPLVPPGLHSPYSRLHLDGLSLSITQTKHNTDERHSTSLSFTLNDVSIFLFTRPLFSETSSSEHRLNAFPLLLIDHPTVEQYSGMHRQPDFEGSYPKLPSFDLIDWTHSKTADFGVKVSQWKARVTKHHTQQQQSYSLMQSRLASSPAIVVEGTNTIDTNWQMKLDIRVAPLHLRGDLSVLTHEEGILLFLDELRCMRQMEAEKTFVKTSTLPAHRESLEAPRPHISIFVPLVRLSLRSPPPANCTVRSGYVIADLHGIRVSSGNVTPSHPRARFLDPSSSNQEDEIGGGDVVLNAECSRIVASCAPARSHVASAFLSIGSLSEPLAYKPDRQDIHEMELPNAPLKPRVSIIKPGKSIHKTKPIQAFSIDIPAIHAELSKPQFDALQYWADDTAQYLERISGKRRADDEITETASQDTSMVGSKFFARSKTGSSLSNSAAESGELIIKTTITEVFLRICLPRGEEGVKECRPFDVMVSDVDVLLELGHENQTTLNVDVSSGQIVDMTEDGILRGLLEKSQVTTPKPMIKLRFGTSIQPHTNIKETRIKLSLQGFCYNIHPDFSWINELALFAKNPPGTFEAVIPSDRTKVGLKILDGSIRVFGAKHPGSLVSYIQELDFSTDVVGKSPESTFEISAASFALLAIDDVNSIVPESRRNVPGVSFWTSAGYALVAHLAELKLVLHNQTQYLPAWKVIIDQISLQLHLCADTMTAVTSFIQDLTSVFTPADETPKVSTIKRPTMIKQNEDDEIRMMVETSASVDEQAFKKLPDIGPAPDMIYDDLPTNLEYLDVSYGTAAGLREIRDDDLDDFDREEVPREDNDPSTISRIGGETIKIFESSGLEAIEDYFTNIPPDTSQGTTVVGDATFSLRISNGHLGLFLYDGYDWEKTRKTIEEGVKEMRKKLAKIRQLVATGQLQDPSVEDTSDLLFNSVYIGLEQDETTLGEPAALIAAIDEELKEELETGSQSSWQSLRPTQPAKAKSKPVKLHGKSLTRPRTPSIEFSIQGATVEFDKFKDDNSTASRTFVLVRDLEILDHIKTSTWKKFLTQLKQDSRGNVRETDSNMVRIELCGVRPVPGQLAEESRLKAKILPLRLYVDQDAVDFLKKFFSFKAPSDQVPGANAQPDEDETCIQMAEIFPIDLKLDYKPRRVDYRALKEGKTIELMNFFHFDGAEMTLRHITLAGVTGWGKLFEKLNDLWTPDVKATQLVEVISGVAPIRSLVNVGSGVADLILLPIAQYKKDGRVARGVQKGATAFVKTTAIEAIKMGAKLATGTQVILEQAEDILGGQEITAETVQVPTTDDLNFSDDDNETSAELISRYAQQPADIREGVQSAYKSMQRNLNSAAQTILAVPMRVYEESGNEGPIRSVIRAVPIAVLKPMIGASEAVSKTLLGLHNTLDPTVRQENEAKYKLR
ncbi:hypothetical protein CVT24_007729 [Panaeolus cyanescens]|uniref:Autophagy-related protein 2 n=1 Tax=Panaeolus cyanescens TaxID=181874 RepID=A0A409YM07_9AGAR|nr:hypothetical protein CVT24_007729 [Panaeolus cyanescens]